MNAVTANQWLIALLGLGLCLSVSGCTVDDGDETCVCPSGKVAVDVEGVTACYDSEYVNQGETADDPSTLDDDATPEELDRSECIAPIGGSEASNGSNSEECSEDEKICEDGTVPNEDGTCGEDGDARACS